MPAIYTNYEEYLQSALVGDTFRYVKDGQEKTMKMVYRSPLWHESQARWHQAKARTLTSEKVFDVEASVA